MNHVAVQSSVIRLPAPCHHFQRRQEAPRGPDGVPGQKAAPSRLNAIERPGTAASSWPRPFTPAMTRTESATAQKRRTGKDMLEPQALPQHKHVQGADRNDQAGQGEAFRQGRKNGNDHGMLIERHEAVAELILLRLD